VRPTRISISGHAVLADLDIEVRDHLVIVGANDVGKTSILRLLNLLLGASVQSLYQSLGPNEISDDAEALVVSARLEDFTPDEEGYFAFAMCIEDDAPDYVLVQLEVSVAADDEESVTIERFFPTTNSRRGPTREQLGSIGWKYLPANRSGNADFIDGRHSPFRAMLSAVDIDEDAENLGDLLEQFNESLKENSALGELRKEIASHLSRAVPRSYDEDSLVIRTTADPRDEPLRDVSLFLREGERLKALTEQSDGMRQLMMPGRCQPRVRLRLC